VSGICNKKFCFRKCIMDRCLFHLDNKKVYTKFYCNKHWKKFDKIIDKGVGM